MSLAKSIVRANDQMLVNAHKLFLAWKQQHLNWYKKSSDHGLVLKHFSIKQCRRIITKTCPTFKSQKTYARSITTTYAIGSKVYWKAHDDPAWKQACRTAPPVPRNGAPVRVLFDHQRMATYRFDFAFVYALKISTN